LQLFDLGWVAHFDYGFTFLGVSLDFVLCEHEAQKFLVVYAENTLFVVEYEIILS